MIKKTYKQHHLSHGNLAIWVRRRGYLGLHYLMCILIFWKKRRSGIIWSIYYAFISNKSTDQAEASSSIMKKACSLVYTDTRRKHDGHGLSKLTSLEMFTYRIHLHGRNYPPEIDQRNSSLSLPWRRVRLTEWSSIKAVLPTPTDIRHYRLVTTVNKTNID